MQALLAAKRRDRAIVALKKKKLHDKQALQLEHNILLLDERMIALETTAQQADLVSALKAANGAIKQMQRQTPLEDVEKLLSNNAESAEYVVRPFVVNDVPVMDGHQFVHTAACLWPQVLQAKMKLVQLSGA